MIKPAQGVANQGESASLPVSNEEQQMGICIGDFAVTFACIVFEVKFVIVSPQLTNNLAATQSRASDVGAQS